MTATDLTTEGLRRSYRVEEAGLRGVLFFPMTSDAGYEFDAYLDLDAGPSLWLRRFEFADSIGNIKGEDATDEQWQQEIKISIQVAEGELRSLRRWITYVNSKED